MTKPAIKSISFRAPPDLVAWLQRLADKRGASVGATVRELLETSRSAPAVTLAETPNQGRIGERPTRPCPACEGTGKVKGWSTSVMAMIDCRRCAGSGRVLA
jgi:hypothetical protein